MNIQLSVDTSQFAAALSSAVLPTMNEMIEVGRRQAERIRLRTSSATGTNGPFKSLNAGYARAKAKHGGAPIANLRSAGNKSDHMLDQIEVRPGTADFTGVSASIGIYGSKGIIAAAHQNGAGRLPARPFMGATEEEVQLMQDDLNMIVSNRNPNLQSVRAN